MRRGFFILWCMLLWLPPLRAQDYPRQNIDLDLLVQELFAEQDDESISYEDLYETLFQYYQRPINLNRTSPEELASLYLLSRPQLYHSLITLKRTGTY